MTYKPKPGSYTARAIEELAEGPMSLEHMAGFLGLDRRKVDPYLMTAIKAGAIVRTKVGDERGFALPVRATGFLEVPLFTEPAGAPDSGDDPQMNTVFDDEQPEPEAFSACLWADGDLDVFGVVPIEQNGCSGVRLTRDQVAQLMRLLSGCTVSL